jgi:hypothetical protein
MLLPTPLFIISLDDRRISTPAQNVTTDKYITEIFNNLLMIILKDE